MLAALLRKNRFLGFCLCSRSLGALTAYPHIILYRCHAYAALLCIIYWRQFPWRYLKCICYNILQSCFLYCTGLFISLPYSICFVWRHQLELRRFSAWYSSDYKEKQKVWGCAVTWVSTLRKRKRGKGRTPSLQKRVMSYGVILPSEQFPWPVLLCNFMNNWQWLKAGLLKQVFGKVMCIPFYQCVFPLG